MVKFICENCDHLIGTALKNAGQLIRCPHCGKLSRVNPVAEDALVLESLEELTRPMHDSSPGVIVTERSAPAVVAPPATFARSSTAARVVTRVANEANLPVRRETPGQPVRYCISGFDRAIQMKVKWVVSAPNREAAQEQAEHGGIEVYTIMPQQPESPDEPEDSSSDRRQRR